MKLVHPDFSFQVELCECSICKLVIEAPKLFYALTTDLLNQSEGSEGKFVLSDNGKIQRISEKMYNIINPFSIELNTKKALTKLYGILKEQIQSTESIVRLNQIQTMNIQLLENIFELVMFPLTYSTEIDINSFLKYMDVRFEMNDSDLIGKIVDYMRLMQEIFRYSIAFLVNMEAYLEEYEIEQLYKLAQLQKISLLLIESNNNRGQRKNEKIYIIDQDCCEIVIDAK